MYLQLLPIAHIWYSLPSIIKKMKKINRKSNCQFQGEEFLFRLLPYNAEFIYFLSVVLGVFPFSILFIFVHLPS
jgi:hypothetical protein